MTVTLDRIDMTPTGTHGRISIDGEHVCYTVERPWLNNKRNESCIPAGTYDLAWQFSPKFGTRLHVLDVEDRSHILVHKGNWQKDTLGCIMPVTTIGMLQGECCGYRSEVALAVLEKRLPQGQRYKLVIREYQLREDSA